MIPGTKNYIRDKPYDICYMIIQEVEVSEKWI